MILDIEESALDPSVGEVVIVVDFPFKRNGNIILIQWLELAGA